VHIATGGRAFVPGAPYMIFLHGSGQSHLTWVLQTRYFAYEGYNIVAPDFPGHGLSKGNPLSTIRKMADWVKTLMNVLGVDEAVIVGHSQGCLVGLELVAQNGGCVSKLVLISGALSIPVNDYLVESSANKLSAAISMMTSWGHGRLAQFHDNSQPGISLLGFGRALMMTNDKTALHTDLQACNLYDAGDDAANSVIVPCLVILAGADKMIPIKQGRLMAKAIVNSQLIEIPGAGHFLPAEHPDDVNKSLARFLVF
jgi:pimeloyl-ACP methyl ester carboxylesterase